MKTGNHLRLAVVVMLCLALLAGWGLDDLTERGSRGATSCSGSRARCWSARCWCWPRAASSAPGVLGRRARGRVGLLVARRRPPGRRDDHGDPDGLADRLADVHGPGRGAAGAARLRWRLAATAFVGAGDRARGGDLFKAGMGATPAIDTEQATQPSTPGPALPAVAAPNRFVGIRRPLGPVAAGPQRRHALGPVRRAQLGPAGGGALRHALAARGARRRADRRAHHQRAADARRRCPRSGC